MAPTDWRQPRLAQLQAAGSKLIAYHGASDGAFSLQATIDWYEALRMNNGGDVADFARFYPVPGMTHCGGGPATDRFDLFSALVDWVERGKAPADRDRDGAGRQPRAAAGLEPDALAAALRLAPSRALPRHRRPRVGRELPLRVSCCAHQAFVIVTTITAPTLGAVLTRGNGNAKKRSLGDERCRAAARRRARTRASGCGTCERGESHTRLRNTPTAARESRSSRSRPTRNRSTSRA